MAHSIKCSNLSRRQREKKLSVKSSWTSQSRINRINPIGCSNDDYLPTTVQTIHESKEG